MAATVETGETERRLVNINLLWLNMLKLREKIKLVFKSADKFGFFFQWTLDFTLSIQFYFSVLVFLTLNRSFAIGDDFHN